MASKDRANQITFKINGLTPATLPSIRLAQYLLDLNALLGSAANVHFTRLGKGSAQIVQWAEPKALAEIRKRIMSVSIVDKSNVAPELSEAYDKINRHLIDDNAAGKLRIGHEKVLEFPGRHTEARKIIGPVTQNDYLDGQLVRIGGIDATVPVHLREGEDFHFCTANVTVAKQLAPYLYGQTIRVYGVAYWYRYPQGVWKLDHFRVETFRPLEDTSLHEAVERIRAVPHDDWDESAPNKIKIREG